MPATPCQRNGISRACARVVRAPSGKFVKRDRFGMHRLTHWLRHESHVVYARMGPFARPVRLIVGAVVLAVGLLGLLLPILPGWVFIGVGLVIIAPRSRAAHWVRGQLARLRCYTRRLVGRHKGRCDTAQLLPGDDSGVERQ